jgi:Uncharacterized protein conserved in bacteria
MSVSMHKASIPVFIRGLEALSAILGKASAYAKEKKIDESTLINARLAPDMFPLSRQIQSASDTAKFAITRLTGIEAPKYEDNEATLAELQERIAKTVTFLKNVDIAVFKDSEAHTVTMHFGKSQSLFRGSNYLLHFALPNFYFHVTTAYDILRHLGLNIGKRDFLGSYDESQEMNE